MPKNLYNIHLQFRQAHTKDKALKPAKIQKHPATPIMALRGAKILVTKKVKSQVRNTAIPPTVARARRGISSESSTQGKGP